MDAAYATDGILDFETPASDQMLEPQQSDSTGPADPGIGPGQGDATVLAWARAM